MPSPTKPPEICACGHPSQDHDPWPDCEKCECREWRPIREAVLLGELESEPKTFPLYNDGYRTEKVPVKKEFL